MRKACHGGQQHGSPVGLTTSVLCLTHLVYPPPLPTRFLPTMQPPQTYPATTLFPSALLFPSVTPAPDHTFPSPQLNHSWTPAPCYPTLVMKLLSQHYLNLTLSPEDANAFNTKMTLSYHSSFTTSLEGKALETETSTNPHNQSRMFCQRKSSTITHANKRPHQTLPSIYLTNACCLTNKLNKLDTIMKQNTFDTALITETWFKDDTSHTTKFVRAEKMVALVSKLQFHSIL